MKKYVTLIILAILLAILLLSGCNSTKQAQRKLNHIIKKHPELSIENNVVITDTLYLTNTEIDTIFSASIDSILITNDSIQIKYIRIKDKVYLSGKTTYKPIIRERIIKVKSPVITKTDPITQQKLNKWRKWCLITWALIAIIIALIAFRKAFKAYLKTLPFIR